MTLQEMDAPALGVEERALTRSPGSEHQAQSAVVIDVDPEVVAKPTRRKFTEQNRLSDSGGGRELRRKPARWAGCHRREGLYS